MAHKRVKGRPDIFGPAKNAWVLKSRKIARELLRSRPWITSEDVTDLNPLPLYFHANTIGRIFRDQPEFKAIGYTIARHAKANGHVIRMWSLTEPLEAPKRIRVRGEYDDGA